MKKTTARLLAEGSLFTHGYRFAAVGVLNGLIGLGITYSCYNLLGVDYRISNAVGYACGMANSFVLNKRWTFRSREDPRIEVLLFLIMFGVSYSLNLAGVIVCVEKLSLNPNLAQLVGVVFYTTSNFFGNRHITFRAARFFRKPSPDS